jgi:hypothetical protein
MPRLGRVYVTQSVSFPPALLDAARKRARNLGLSFSTYVQKCLERDLAERGAIVFQEYEEPVRLALAEKKKVFPEPRKGRPFAK